MRLPKRLPELKGRWLTGYKLLWWVMLAASLVALTAGQWRERQQRAQIELPLYAAGLLPNEDGDALKFSPLSPAARAAGIVPDSTLLAIDGRPVPSNASLQSIARQLEGRDRDTITLHLRTPEGRLGEARVERGAEHLAAANREAPVTYRQLTAISLASATLDALIVMAGAILLFRRRANDPVVALLSFGLLAVPANGIAALVSDPALAWMLDSGLDVVPMACILLGMTVFPAGRFVPRWTLLILPAIAAWGAVILFAGDSVVALAVTALPALVITVSSLARRYVRMEPGPAKQQVKWVTLGFAAFFACGMLQIAVLLVDGGTTDNRAHFALLVANNVLLALQGGSIVGGLLVSLLRYRLYDADAAISRSAVYAALTVTLVAIFAASEEVMEGLAKQWFGAGAGMASGAAAAALAALVLVPLHHRLSRWAEKRFQRDLARMNAQLPELLAELRDSSNPRLLVDDALRLVIGGVRAGHGAILLPGERGWFVADAQGIGADVAAERLAGELPAMAPPGLLQAADRALPLRLPLVTPSGLLIGWLALGPHPDGSLYGKDDRQALEALASPLARALALALERARSNAERDAERRSLGERLATLEGQLSQVLEVVLPPRNRKARAS
jgi:hypothetical protein